ncbi:hypothetical protein DOJK_01549 [Patescibacteria group bacterium]|nr:hypothetical protein DOJK_01549 [Patescibacteria group bacterium]
MEESNGIQLPVLFDSFVHIYCYYYYPGKRIPVQKGFNDIIYIPCSFDTWLSLYVHDI